MFAEVDVASGLSVCEFDICFVLVELIVDVDETLDETEEAFGILSMYVVVALPLNGIIEVLKNR